LMSFLSKLELTSSPHSSIWSSPLWGHW
jgi:hypothetical protein